MAIVLNGTTGITAPDISVTAQSTDITTTGDITAVDATLSGGVYLGGTGSANYLDDYEEGTWTPTVEFGTTTSVSYSRQDGSYTKIGRFVYVDISLIFTFSGSSGQLDINLPFTASGVAPSVNDRGAGSFGYYDNLNVTTPLFLVIAGQSKGVVRKNGNTSVTESDLSGTVNIHASVTYKTS